MANIRKPAILGGLPIMPKPFHLVRPILPRFSEIIHGLEKLYETRMFTNQGVFARSLEEVIANRLQVKHCALFCNGTIAIMCLFKALELQGDIIVPSFTFAATTQALLWQGLSLRFVDINPSDFTLEPDLIDKEITPSTAAIFPVNIFGGCCEHDKIFEIARKKKLPLIYDSAQSFGTLYKNRPVGSLGDAEILSFHATKLFHTGEGGAVVTNDTALYNKLCKIRNFGFSEYLNCTDIGINGKMSEFHALIGLKLIDMLPSHMEKRKWVFQQYRDSLKNIPGLEFPKLNDNVTINYSLFNVIIQPEQFGLSSIELNYALIAENIITRCYFYPPVHRTFYYQKLFGKNLPYLPHTDSAATHILCLPVYSDMETSELARVIEAIISCQFYAEQIKMVLADSIPKNWEAIKSTNFIDPHDKFILKN